MRGECKKAFNSKNDKASALRDAETAVQLGTKVEESYLSSLR